MGDGQRAWIFHRLIASSQSKSRAPHQRRKGRAKEKQNDHYPKKNRRRGGGNTREQNMCFTGFFVTHSIKSKGLCAQLEKPLSDFKA